MHTIASLRADAMACFVVHSLVKLATRPGLFLVGEIKSGNVHAGMMARIQADDRVITAPISEVEFVDHPGGASQVALHVVFPDPADGEVVSALCVESTTLEIV